MVFLGPLILSAEMENYGRRSPNLAAYDRARVRSKARHGQELPSHTNGTASLDRGASKAM